MVIVPIVKLKPYRNITMEELLKNPKENGIVEIDGKRYISEDSANLVTDREDNDFFLFELVELREMGEDERYKPWWKYIALLTQNLYKARKKYTIKIYLKKKEIKNHKDKYLLYNCQIFFENQMKMII